MRITVEKCSLPVICPLPAGLDASANKLHISRQHLQILCQGGLSTVAEPTPEPEPIVVEPTPELEPEPVGRGLFD